MTQLWLVLLDLDEHEFVTRLTVAADDVGLPARELIRNLPIDEVLQMTLSSSSGHWTERALEWLDRRPLPANLVGPVERLSNARWATQRARQIAHRLLRDRQADQSQ